MGGYGRALLGALCGLALFLDTGCASVPKDPEIEAAKAHVKATCERDDCACEERCHVNRVGCPFRHEVCETGLEGCLRACGGAGEQAQWVPAPEAEPSEE